MFRLSLLIFIVWNQCPETLNDNNWTRLETQAKAYTLEKLRPFLGSFVFRFELCEVFSVFACAEAPSSRDGHLQVSGHPQCCQTMRTKDV